MSALAFRPVQHGTTNVSVLLKFLDSNGNPVDVDHATAGLTLWYRRDGGLKQPITPAALASLDAAHTDGGVEAVDDGYSRVDVPDAAFATGVNGVLIGGTITSGVCIGCYVPLLPDDPYAPALTDAQIADAVHDEPLAGHATAGSAGKALADILDYTGTSGVNVSDAGADAVLTRAMTEAYSTDGGTLTPAQALYELVALLTEFSKSGATLTVKKRDGVTTALTLTLDDATTPSSISRSG